MSQERHDRKRQRHTGGDASLRSTHDAVAETVVTATATNFHAYRNIAAEYMPSNRIPFACCSIGLTTPDAIFDLIAHAHLSTTTKQKDTRHMHGCAGVGGIQEDSVNGHNRGRVAEHFTAHYFATEPLHTVRDSAEEEDTDTGPHAREHNDFHYLTAHDAHAQGEARAGDYFSWRCSRPAPIFAKPIGKGPHHGPLFESRLY